MVDSKPQRELSVALRFFGPYWLLLSFIGYALLLLSLSRLGLGWWLADRVQAAISWPSYFLQGVRADLIMVAMWLLPLVLLTPWLARAHNQAVWLKACYSWCLLGLVIFIFMELATPSFIMQYDLRPNRLFVEYLKYPKEVLSTLWYGFRLPLLAGLLLTCLLGLLLAYVLRYRSNCRHQWSDHRLWLTWPLVLVLTFGAIRSTTDHRPANPAFFAITDDALVNALIINSSYSVLYALYSLKHEAHSSDVYGKLSQTEIMTQVLSWPWLSGYKFDNTKLPTLHTQQAVRVRSKPLNLVIVLEESLGATFVESLGGLPVTPELEKLKAEGWWFEQLYATGTRSVRGIEAVISGYMPTPAQSVVKLSLAQKNFFTLGSLLAKTGYHTQFIYGGEAHFDNMSTFFTGNGFKEVIDLADMTKPVFIGSWGASDEDLFNEAQQQLLRLHQQSQPFFSLIFTSSNHTPFEFPDGRISLYEQPKSTANNAVKYADYALGNFIAQAKASPYWQNTVFLVVADHDNRVYGNNLVPVEKFHIPGIILGADLKPKTITPVASQIDLAPTLLSLIGLSSDHPMLGRDFVLDDQSPGRAMMQFEQYYAFMEQQEVTILKPDQVPVSAQYDSANKHLMINKRPPDAASVKRALAHVLLPSKLYREQTYREEAGINVH